MTRIDVDGEGLRILINRAVKAEAQARRAMQREKAALDQADALRAEVAAKDAEIKRLGNVIGEMSE